MLLRALRWGYFINGKGNLNYNKDLVHFQIIKNIVSSKSQFHPSRLSAAFFHKSDHSYSKIDNMMAGQNNFYQEFKRDICKAIAIA